MELPSISPFCYYAPMGQIIQPDRPPDGPRKDQRVMEGAGLKSSWLGGHLSEDGRLRGRRSHESLALDPWKPRKYRNQDASAAGMV